MSRKNWKSGDRCQKSDWEDRKEIITTGTVTDVVTEETTREQFSGFGYSKKTVTETVIKSISVKWDDGKEETGLNQWSINPEDSPLEREFRIKAAEVDALIQAKLDVASQALSEAVAIAEENGVPFHSRISPVRQSYMTRSFPKKWDGVREELASEVTETYSESGGFYGWSHSAVC